MGGAASFRRAPEALSALDEGPGYGNKDDRDDGSTENDFVCVHVFLQAMALGRAQSCQRPIATTLRGQATTRPACAG